jgi:hypothetical protein
VLEVHHQGSGGEVAMDMKAIPTATRPIVQAARKAVKAAAPQSAEIAYEMAEPQSARTMWKLFRYQDEEGNVCGIGTFPDHANLYFYRGRELDDGSGLLQGGGKEMRSITLRSRADLDRPAVRSILRKAFKLGA